MVADFPPSASRQNRQDLVPFFQTVFLAEKSPRQCGLHVSYERVADEFHRHASIGVKLFFERENTQRLRKPPPHQVHAPRPPRPELRTDVIDVSNALGAQLARQAQMKTGEVRQNRKRWPPTLRFLHEPS